MGPIAVIEIISDVISNFGVAKSKTNKKIIKILRCKWHSRNKGHFFRWFAEKTTLK